MAFRGSDIIPLAMAHVGERYILGAHAPVLNPNWKGPWDCAEFTTWCAYQAYRILFGAEPKDPRSADAYSGYWWADSAAPGLRTDVGAALSTPGAFLVRQPRRDLIGHVAISVGDGRVIEAAGRRLGVVCRPNTPDRRWDTGVLLPGVFYEPGVHVGYAEPANILRVVSPYMRGPKIAAVQAALARRDYDPGPIDGIYGELTESAVIALQIDRGLIVDGEVGPQSANELGLGWPIEPTPSDSAAAQKAEDPVIQPAGPAPTGPNPPPLGTFYTFTFDVVGRQNFATRSDGTQAVLLGRPVSYQGNMGLSHQTTQDQALIKPYGEYNRFQAEAALGLWAHFLAPSIEGESAGLFARANTYDPGFLTFGCYQFAAHTPGENLSEWLRDILALPEAKAFFPDLVVRNGRLFQVTSAGSKDLDAPATAGGLATSELALYLNPSLAQVDDVERLALARLISWTRDSQAVRSSQLKIARVVARRKLLAAHGRLNLRGRPLAQCIWVSDILHQGRGKYPRIESALQDPDPLARLSEIGGSTYKNRIEAVKGVIAAMEADGSIAGKVFEDLM